MREHHHAIGRLGRTVAAAGAVLAAALFAIPQQAEASPRGGVDHGHRYARPHGHPVAGHHGHRAVRHVDRRVIRHVPRKIVHKEVHVYRPYYRGRSFHRTHRHHHAIYHFPVHYGRYVAWKPYSYCEGNLYGINAHVSLPRLALSFGFGNGYWSASGHYNDYDRFGSYDSSAWSHRDGKRTHFDRSHRYGKRSHRDDDRYDRRRRHRDDFHDRYDD